MSTVEENAFELEGMTKEDSSWKPCQVSLCSSGVGLLVKFGSKHLQRIIFTKEEALTCLRFRSCPLQGDDCSHIKQGDNVLAADNTHGESLFFDAAVEKVHRVRHSKRTPCRCQFEIKWIQSELRGGTMVVPSKSTMKLSTGSINTHPVVAALLNSVETLNCTVSSSYLSFLEDMDCETDLHRLLEKQIEGISCLADSPQKEFSEDILLGLKKVNLKGQIECKSIATSQMNFSCGQVPHEQNDLRRATRSHSKQVEIGGKDPSFTLLSKEENFENRSHLSPLAARAALASIVSKLPKEPKLSVDLLDDKRFIDVSDKTSDKHTDLSFLNLNHTFMDPALSTRKNVSLTTGPSLKGEASSVPVILEPTKIIESFNPGGKDALEYAEDSSNTLIKGEKQAFIIDDTEGNEIEITDVNTSLMCSVRVRKSNNPMNTRITRSVIQKGRGNPNVDAEKKSCAEDIKLCNPASRTRFTRLAVQKERLDLTMRTELDAAQISNSSAGDHDIPKTNQTKKKTLPSSTIDATRDLSTPKERNKKHRITSTVSKKDEGEISDDAEVHQSKKKKLICSKKPELRFSSRLRFLPRTRSQKKHST